MTTFPRGKRKRRRNVSWRQVALAPCHYSVCVCVRATTVCVCVCVCVCVRKQAEKKCIPSVYQVNTTMKYATTERARARAHERASERASERAGESERVGWVGQRERPWDEPSFRRPRGPQHPRRPIPLPPSGLPLGTIAPLTLRIAFETLLTCK